MHADSGTPAGNVTPEVHYYFFFKLVHLAIYINLKRYELRTDFLNLNDLPPTVPLSLSLTIFSSRNSLEFPGIGIPGT